MLEKRATEVSSGIEVGEPIVASSKEAPAIRMRENIRRKTHPLLGPKPWRTHKNVLKRQVGVYPMSSTMDKSFSFESAMTADNGRFVELTTLRLCRAVSEIR
jgi:hypothetical protein